MKKCTAELLGTFMLVFAGTGSVIVNSSSNGAVTLVGIALTFGLVVMALIYSLGDVSGAHLNPAVTVGLFFGRRIPLATVAPYVLSQCAGAVLASLLLHILFPKDAGLGGTLPSAETMPYQAFILETITTFFLMFVILNVTTGGKEKGVTAGVVIGSVVTLEILFTGPICGASMNPARSLGPALISGHVEHLWIYLIAPVIGASLAVLGCAYIREDASEPVAEVRKVSDTVLAK